MADAKAPTAPKQSGDKPAAKKATAPKRKMLTPAEKVAKLEADLKAAREAAEAKGKVTEGKLREERAKLVTKRDALNKKIEEIDGQLPSTDPIVAASEAAAEGDS